jgi:urea transport system permease protein
MPDGIYGWFTKGGFASMLAAFGIAKKTSTYPKLDIDESVREESFKV